MLRDARIIGEVTQAVGVNDFYADAHQKVYRAIISLHDAGTQPDLVTVAEWLKSKGWERDVGYPLVGELWDAAPTAANAAYYAGIVRDKAIVAT